MFFALIHECGMFTYQKTTKQWKLRNCSYIQQHGLILETKLNEKSYKQKCILCNSPLCVFQQLAESESVSRSVVFDSLDPMDCRQPGSSVHGILQARILEWVSMSSSKVSSPPRDQTWVSCIAGRHFTILDKWEAP